LLHVDRIVKWVGQHTAVLFSVLQAEKTQSVKKLVQIQLLHLRKVTLSFLRAAIKRKNTFFWTRQQQEDIQELDDAIVEVLGVPLESFEHDIEQGDGEQGDGDEGAGVPADNEDNANEDGGLDEQVVDRLMQEIEREVELERAPEGDQGDEWVDEEPDLERDLALLRMGLPLR
jgi:hypothetical protein